MGGPPGRPPVAGLTHSGVGPPPRPGASFWARSTYTFGVPRALSWHGAGVLANGWDNSRLFAMEFRGHGGLGNPRSTATLSDLFRAVPSRAETRRAGPILPSRQSRAEPGQAGPSLGTRIGARCAVVLVINWRCKANLFGDCRSCAVGSLCGHGHSVCSQMQVAAGRGWGFDHITWPALAWAAIGHCILQAALLRMLCGTFSRIPLSFRTFVAMP